MLIFDALAAMDLKAEVCQHSMNGVFAVLSRLLFNSFVVPRRCVRIFFCKRMHWGMCQGGAIRPRNGVLEDCKKT